MPREITQEEKIDYVQFVALEDLATCRYVYDDTIRQAVKAAAYRTGTKMNDDELKSSIEIVQKSLAELYQPR